MEKFRQGIAPEVLRGQYYDVYVYMQKQDPRQIIERDRRMRAVALLSWRDSTLTPSERLYQYFRIANLALGTAVEPSLVASVYLREASKETTVPEERKAIFNQKLRRYFEHIVMSPMSDIQGDLTDDDIADARALIDSVSDIALMQQHAKKEGWREHESARLLLAELLSRKENFQHAVQIIIEAAHFLYGVHLTKQSLRAFHETSTPIVSLCGPLQNDASHTDLEVRKKTLVRLLRAGTQVSPVRTERFAQSSRDALLALAVQHLGMTSPGALLKNKVLRGRFWLRAVAHRAHAAHAMEFAALFDCLINAIDTSPGDLAAWQGFLTISMVEVSSQNRRVLFRYSLDETRGIQQRVFLERRLFPEIQAIANEIPTSLLGALVSRFGENISSIDVGPMDVDLGQRAKLFPTLRVPVPSNRRKS